MRFRNKLALTMLFPICLGAGTRAKKIGYSFTSEDVLYKATGDRNVDFRVSIKTLKNGTYSLVARLYNNRTNSLIFSASFNDVFVAKEKKTYTISYPLRYHLTGDGLRFNYEVTYNTTTTTWNDILYPYSKVEVNANNYRNSVYTSSNRFIKVETDEIVTGESFSFINFNEYLSKNIDNSLDFSSVIFNYLNKYDFRYTKAEYHIKDYKNVYPNLKKENGEVVINMNCVNNNGEISLELNDELYVNNKTLEMSTTKIKDYTSTDQLFIPVNKQDLLAQNDSYIVVKEAGYSAVDIILPLSFYFDKKIIGLCYDSDYCIEGGVKE